MAKVITLIRIKEAMYNIDEGFPLFISELSYPLVTKLLLKYLRELMTDPYILDKILSAGLPETSCHFQDHHPILTLRPKTTLEEVLSNDAYEPFFFSQAFFNYRPDDPQA
jgi:hypothetical protein